MRHSKPLIIAHRGASGLVEFGNTMEAFEKAIEVGAPMMEFDVRKTKDQQLVCFHDPEINGKRISGLTYKEIVQYSRQRGFTPPLVKNVLQFSRDKIQLDIELKERGYETQVVDLVREHLEYSEFIIKSFHDSTVRTIKEYDPNIHVGLLLGKSAFNFGITRILELFPEYRIRNTRADFVSPNYRLLHFCFLERMHVLGKNALVWTVNEKNRMKHLLNKGVDGLITDRPDIALELLTHCREQAKKEKRR